MLEVLALHDSHDGSHAQTVVSTERRALGAHPALLVDIGLDGVGLEVVRAVRCLLRHHVHVGLQHDALAVLIARSGRLAHDDVAASVLECLYADALGEVEQKLLYFLCVA